jgi:hypothetical protein
LDTENKFWGFQNGQRIPMCHRAIVASCHHAVVPLCHRAIGPSCHCAIIPLCHCAIMPSCHHAIMPSCYHAIMPSCHYVMPILVKVQRERKWTRKSAISVLAAEIAGNILSSTEPAIGNVAVVEPPLVIHDT